jgi:hypothetical protein
MDASVRSTLNRDASSPPVLVSIPAVGYAARIRPVGVDDAGAMALPANPETVGWYRYGSAPADPGSTVVAGHLDSFTYGLGPLVRLREVVAGDRVEVSTADGRRTSYVVLAVQRIERSSLPAEIFSRDGPRLLRVITCGGEYDADAGGYQDNLVVTAEPARG